jgi:hypothetical protein
MRPALGAVHRFRQPSLNRPRNFCNWISTGAAHGSGVITRLVKEPTMHHHPAGEARITLRALLAAGLAAATLSIPGYASARPAPLDPPEGIPVAVHVQASGGRTDQQFWGEATWLNPLSGLNLDRSSVAH